nr:hypothetical protein VDP59_012940 [Xanthomonas campestris pv. campestris]
MLPRQAPISGNTPCVSDNSNAKISAIWPSSGVMGVALRATEKSHLDPE